MFNFNGSIFLFIFFLFLLIFLLRYTYMRYYLHIHHRGQLPSTNNVNLAPYFIRLSAMQDAREQGMRRQVRIDILRYSERNIDP